jgi:VIT1/CCC1 family predicted Fe2+/Mn2+ transporter
VLALIVLGYAGARAGGAAPLRPMLRVVGGGIVAMAATMAIGKLFGAAVG